MKKTIIKKIKTNLLLERDAILSKQLEPIDIDTEGDEIDKIQSNIIIHTHKQLMLRDSLRLKSIDAALLKLDEGSFGICEECAELISEKRLLINPMCINCIGCAEELERQAKNTRM